MAEHTSIIYQFGDMKVCSKKISKVIGTLGYIKLSIKQKSDSMADRTWYGSAQNAFKEECIALLNLIDGVVDALKERKDMLDNAIATMEQAEQALNTKADDLSGSGIFE